MVMSPVSVCVCVYHISNHLASGQGTSGTPDKLIIFKPSYVLLLYYAGGGVGLGGGVFLAPPPPTLIAEGCPNFGSVG